MLIVFVYVKYVISLSGNHLTFLNINSQLINCTVLVYWIYYYSQISLHISYTQKRLFPVSASYNITQSLDAWDHFYLNQ